MTCEEEIRVYEDELRRLRVECQRLEREENYTEALKVLHEIDDVQRRKEVLKNSTISKQCVDTYKLPRNIQIRI
jgi:hypothetical protein